MATQATNAAELREKLVAEQQKKVDEQNKAKTGKGTRLRVGQTRGKNPQIITWEAFDESQPDTLPANLKEFMELTNTDNEKTILDYVIVGFNDAQYTAASDPIAEFVNPAWPDEIQKSFRTVVRQYSMGANIPLEKAVELIKPGIEAAFQAKQNAPQPA